LLILAGTELQNSWKGHAPPWLKVCTFNQGYLPLIHFQFHSIEIRNCSGVATGRGIR